MRMAPFTGRVSMAPEFRDANGRVVRVVGSTGDISAEKTLERERDEARTRLSVALELMSQGFALFDAEDRLCDVQQSLSPLLHRRRRSGDRCHGGALE